MYRLLLSLALLALAACEPATSRRPLVSESGPPPQTGLWAVLEPGCSQPSNGAVQTWPECATPVWLQPGKVTTIVRSPVRSDFVVGSGEPRIAQVARENEAGERRYSYFAFRTLDAPPHDSALVWFIFCDADRGVTEAVKDDSECLIEDHGELRRLARIAVMESDAGRAVRISPG